MKYTKVQNPGWLISSEFTATEIEEIITASENKAREIKKRNETIKIEVTREELTGIVNSVGYYVHKEGVSSLRYLYKKLERIYNNGVVND